MAVSLGGMAAGWRRRDAERRDRDILAELDPPPHHRLTSMSAPNAWLETGRLALHAFTPYDEPWFAELYADDRVARFIGGVKTRDQAGELFRSRVLAYYAEHLGFGIWQTVERATGRPVGFHLLNHLRGESDIQVGYALVPDVWGRGYATEMALALLDYGFTRQRLPRIVAIANPPNVASQRVLVKIGLARKGDRTLADPFYAAQGPMAWFERDRDAWLAERAASP